MSSVENIQLNLFETWKNQGSTLQLVIIDVFEGNACLNFIRVEVLSNEDSNLNNTKEI